VLVSHLKSRTLMVSHLKSKSSLEGSADPVIGVPRDGHASHPVVGLHLTARTVLNLRTNYFAEM